MADRIVLHIGAPKAATTYLQSLWWANRVALHDAGVRLPGRVRFDHNRAAQAVRGAGGERATETWHRLREEIAESGRTVLLSNEWFTMASTSQVATLVEELGGTDRVEVLLTARDAAGTVRAAWQEAVKLGHGSDLDAFVDALDDGSRRWSWRHLDPAQVLPRWVDVLPAEQVHVVTLPGRRAAPETLWERVAEVLDVPSTTCDVGLAFRNASLSVEASRLLERIGPRLRETLRTGDAAWNTPYRWIRDEVAHRGLGPHPGAPIALGEANLARLRERNATTRRWLEGSGVHLVGDLGDLEVRPEDATARRPDAVSDHELVDAAGALTAHLLGELRTTRIRLRRAERELASVRAEAEAAHAALRAERHAAARRTLRGRAGRLRRAVTRRRSG